MKLILVRHGETDINYRGLTHTTNDSAGLNLNGRKQIEKLSNAILKNRVEVLYSSPEKRAIETAEIISNKLGINIQILDGLRERNWGEWSSQPWDWIQNNLKRMTFEERYTFKPPHGESWVDMNKRLEQIVNSVISTNNNVLIVTHGGVLRALMPILKDVPKEASFQYDFKNASMTVFERINNNFEEISINDTSFM